MLPSSLNKGATKGFDKGTPTILGEPSCPKYIYGPILGESIRLLNLLPGKASETIRCELSVSTLDSTPSYEAISYVWGDAAAAAAIELNGHPFAVRFNLTQCLRQLRRAHATRTIWVDALCINQTDVEEKGHQVNLMSKIYRLAQRTLIWLGEDQQLPTWRAGISTCLWPAAASSSVQLCCGCSTGDQIPVFMALSDAFSLLEDLASNSHLVYSTANLVKGSGLFHIIGLPWWQRVWVVQETLLSAFPVLVLGASYLAWEVAFSAAKNFVKHCTTCCRPEFAMGYCSQSVSLYHDYMMEVCSAILSFQSAALENTNKLLSYLWMIRHKDATELCDKIYAVLGLLPSGTSTDLKPNYGIGFSSLCGSVVLDNIKMTGTLEVLKGSRAGSASSPEVPTWATDWGYKMHSVEERNRILSELSRQVYSASRGHPPLWNLPSPDVLSISGTVFDVIDGVGDVGVGGYDDDLRIAQMEVLNKWIEMVKVLQRGHKKYPGGGTHFTAFWRTILADSVLPERQRLDPHHGSMDWRTPAESNYSSLRRTRPSDAIIWSLWWLWRNDEIQPGVMVPAVRNIGSSVTRATAGRRFFITSKGYLGLGPESTETGDGVSLLLGGSTPFLLRKSAPSNGQYQGESHHARPENTYILLGDCYVHGCMDGELLDGVDVLSKAEYLFLK